MIPTQVRRSALNQLFTNYSSLKLKNNNLFFSSTEESEKYAKMIELYAYNKAVQAKTPQVYTDTLVNLKPLYYYWYLENKETITKILKLFGVYKMYHLLNENSEKFEQLWNHYIRNPLTWPVTPQDLENISFIKKETSRLVKEYQEKKSQIMPKVATPQQILHSHRTNLLESMVALRRHIESNETNDIISVCQKLFDCLEKIINMLILENLVLTTNSNESTSKSEGNENIKLIIKDYSLWVSINKTLGNCNDLISMILLSQNNHNNSNDNNITPSISNQNILSTLLFLESDMKLLHELFTWSIHENHQSTLSLPISQLPSIENSLKRKIDEVSSEQPSLKKQSSSTSLVIELVNNIIDLKNYFQQKYPNLTLLLTENLEEILHNGFCIRYSSQFQTHSTNYQLQILFNSEFFPIKILLSYSRNNIRSVIPSLVTPFITSKNYSSFLKCMEYDMNNSLQIYSHSHSTTTTTNSIFAHIPFIERIFDYFLTNINKF